MNLLPEGSETHPQHKCSLRKNQTVENLLLWKLFSIATGLLYSMSLLSEHMQNSCLAHIFVRVKAIYCYYRNHVTMTIWFTFITLLFEGQ